MVPSAEDHAAAPIAAAASAEDHAAAPIAAAASVEVLTAVPVVVEASAVEVTAEVDTAVAVAEWADADKSEHQLPDFRIRHPRNLAH